MTAARCRRQFVGHRQTRKGKEIHNWQAYI